MISSSVGSGIRGDYTTGRDPDRGAGPIAADGVKRYGSSVAGRTETASNSAPGKEHGASYLVLAFHSERASERPSRHRLRSGDEVLINRGDARTLRRTDSPPQLILEEDDARMSSSHVRMREA